MDQSIANLNCFLVITAKNTNDRNYKFTNTYHASSCFVSAVLGKKRKERKKAHDMTGWKTWQHLSFQVSVLIYFTATLGMNFYKALSKAQRIAFQGQNLWPKATTEIMLFLVELQWRTSAEPHSLMDVADILLGKLIAQHHFELDMCFKNVKLKRIFCILKLRSLQNI